MMNTAEWAAVLILGLVIDLVLIVRAISRGHGVEGTLAWIFAILALPGVGALAYLTLSSPSIERTSRRKRSLGERIRENEACYSRAFSRESIQVDVGCDHGILDLATNVTGLPPTNGNELRLLHRNREAFREIEDSLRGAQRSIWAEYYIIENDETGHRFLDLLVDKAKEGLEIRLLYDAVGSFRIDKKRVRQIVQSGGRAEAFLPVNPLARRWSVHLRNHRKMIVVDGALGFAGGMNVGDEYSGRKRGGGSRHFHDTHMRLEGPVVADLSLTFAEDWHFATGERLILPPRPENSSDGKSTVAVIPSGPDVHPNPNALMYFSGIASATDRVFLTSPYFVPCEPTIRALISSALRGVDVRVLVPAVGDIKIVDYAARSYFYALVENGVRVFEYQPSMLHAKTMVVDGAWGYVGSANVDIRSFRLNFEFGAVVVDPIFAANLERRFLRDLEHSLEVTMETIRGWGPVTRFAQDTAKLLSPLL